MEGPMSHPDRTGEDSRRTVHVEDVTEEEAKMILDALAALYPAAAKSAARSSPHSGDEFGDTNNEIEL